MENRIAEKISATKQLFYYQSIADGTLKIQETMKQLDKNINKATTLYYIINLILSKRPHIIL
jgi:hypothetical protein